MKNVIITIYFYVFLTNIICGQLYIDYDNIEKDDLLDALSFAGIGIFKFNVDSTNDSYDFYLISEEYAGKGNLIHTDTLLGDGYFKLTNDDIDTIRIITRIYNDSFTKVKLFISTPSASTWQELKMTEEFARKHYWVKFEKSEVINKTKVPLLFFGSEWDSIYMGEKTTRFCALPEIPVDLNFDACGEMPHFYIISYLLK